MTPTDHDLLRSYVQDGSQAAFAELVARHLNLVYSAAQRQVRSAALAEEIAQSVFLDLSRQPAALKPGTPLVAWLHLVTRRTAIDVIRRESRRRAREQAAGPELVEWAATTLDAMKPIPSAWAEVEPLLDEAVDTLAPADRTAVLLRFFENKSLRDIGAVIGTSEDTAQKRVSRALDQLRTFFLRRGIAVTASGLTADLSAHALQVAPATLSATISSATVLSTTASSTLTTETAKALAMTTTQKSIVVATLVVAVGAVLHQAQTISSLRNQIHSLEQQSAGLAAQLRDSNRRQAELSKELTATIQPRAVVANDSAAPDTENSEISAELKAIAARIVRFKARLAQSAAQQIPELQLLDERDWIEITRTYQKTDSDDDIWDDVTADLRQKARTKFAVSFDHAVDGYLRANFGQLPVDPAQLAPFLTSPVDPAILGRYQMLVVGKLADLPFGTIIAGEKSLLAGDYAGVVFRRDSNGDTNWHSGGGNGPLYMALMEFAKANGGQPPTDALQLLPYFKTLVQPSDLTRQWNDYRRDFRDNMR